jgi:uncharacterized protein (TIGR02118 family)
MRKVVAVAHDGLPHEVDTPRRPGIVGASVHTPSPEVPATQPERVQAIWFVWVDDAVDAREVATSLVRDDTLHAYVVEERVQWDYQRDWPDGEASPGIKQLSFVRRVPALTREQFAAHWNDIHAPLARVHHPGIWRYVQNVVVEPLTAGAPELDGVAELHFRTHDDLQHRMYDSEDGKALIRADVRTFLDVPAGWRMLATERILRTSAP